MAVNQLVYQFPGNHYMLPDIITAIFTCFMASKGLKIYFTEEVWGSFFLREFGLGILLFSLVLWGSESIQQTPFTPIDNALIKFDKLLNVRVNDYVASLEYHPYVKKILDFFYNSVSCELILVPSLLMIFRRYVFIYEYYSLVFLTAIIGYSIYYFFPTIAPASSIGGLGFTQEQYATGIKFNEIHHYISPSTKDGGLISFPSFHAIWALLLVYSVRCWTYFCSALLIFNSMIIIACVILGWHYMVDILGSIAVILLSIWFNHILVKKEFM